MFAELPTMLDTDSSSSSLGFSVPLFPSDCLKDLLGNFGRTMEVAVIKVQPWSVVVQCASEVIPWAGRDIMN